MAGLLGIGKVVAGGVHRSFKHVQGRADLAASLMILGGLTLAVLTESAFPGGAALAGLALFGGLVVAVVAVVADG